jgi:hypothetical protein
LEATRALCRRVEREHAERIQRERAAAARAATARLIAAAERKIDARLTVQGQLVAAIRRGSL